ncbi:hypothetical protein PV336_16300 [Streptomyces sp. MI02-2A]|uniref:hypothetical protein n=1 Tax=Streptomyces sp. MI02-2A TaxID=3028688 RepID=UPI0029B7AD6B|nr:hypothetical protein [Streptomyces sp. MI02-2A]MDX3260783.1 hypothetical protein [Streptomyces sp. MI02-2A]
MTDYREIEDPEMRRAWKERTFHDYYGQVGAEARRFPPRVLDVPVPSVSGRMVVHNPPLRTLPRADGKMTLDLLVERLIDQGRI